MKIEKPKTFLAIDFGLRKMGIAIGNNISNSAQPLMVIKAENGEPDWDRLIALIAEWRPDKVIVGDPINMDDSNGQMSQRARSFARRLGGRIKLPVILVDERLSTREAQWRAREAGARSKPNCRPTDHEAAAVILSSFLNDL